MTEGNNSHKDGRSTVSNMEQELASWELERDKILRRLKGYETVAKLANEKQSAYNELEKVCNELRKEICELKGNKSEEQRQPSLEPNTNNEQGGISIGKISNDVSSVQGLNELQSANSQRGNSSSFTVLGKNSRDVHVNNNDTPKLQSLGNSPNGSIHQETFSVPYQPQRHNEAFVVENESLNSNVVVESTVAHHDMPQTSSLVKEGQSVKCNSSDDFIQVFPEDWQSGGSNFIDSRVIGDQSRMNSSKRGPMSIVAVSNGSIPSYQYVEMKRGDERKDLEQNKSIKSESDAVLVSTTGLTTHSDLYNGTGARPKGFSSQLNKPVGEEECAYTDLKPPTSNSARNMMVKIPCENSDAYRINTAPMLSYGKQESQTEISDLTSFETSLSSQSPLKMLSEVGIGKYNNLNMAGNNSQKNLQEKKTEEFVVIEEVPPLNPSMDPMIPVIKPVSTEPNFKENNALLMKELDTLRKKVTQLHIANKEWKGSWDVLQKQKEGDIERLQVQLNTVTHEKDRMKREMENHITSLKEELKDMNVLKKDAEKAYLALLTGRSQEKQLLEKLKQDYGTLHQEKRTLEIQLEVLQANQPPEELRPTEVLKTNSDLQTELAVVKRQVTLFMDDFNKEHQERLVIEKRLQKEKELHQSLEPKLKKAHSLLKSRDEDLRQKSKLVADLQFQVDDLKLKLEIEQRRASIYPSMEVTTLPSSQANVEVSYQSEASVGPARNDPTTAHINLNVHAPKKWSCIACTYDNKMSHNKCEVCGMPYTIPESNSHVK